MGVAGRRVHVRPVVVAQRVHAVCMVLVRDPVVCDVSDGLVEMVVGISGGGHHGHGGRGGGARVWNLLLQRAEPRR